MAQGVPFKDVPPTLEDIRFLYEKGIVQGYPDGTFRGKEYITRYQAAAMLYRAYLAFADDVARRVREALAQESQARLEEALAAIRDLQEAVRIVREAMGDWDEVKATLEETRKEVEDLADDLARVSSQMITREEIADLVASVGTLERLIGKGEEELKALQARVKALEDALKDLEGRHEAGQGELNKKLYDLTGRVDTLEKKDKNAPKLSVRGSVGFSDGKADGAVEVRGEANGVRLFGRMSSDGIQVRASQGGLFLEGRTQGGMSESRIGYRLFEGVGLVLNLGYGDSAFATVGVVHEPDGGVIPGLVGEARVGAGFYEGSLSRNLLQIRVGYRFGNVTPSLGYYRYRGENPSDLLEARVDWGADFGSLEGYYRLVNFPESGDKGNEWGVRFTSSSNPFVELGVRRTTDLVTGEPGSFTFRYEPATGSKNIFTIRLGYELEF